MKKNLFQKVVYLLLFTSVILSLTSCGDISKTSNSTKLSNEPILISKAFSQEGIWFNYYAKNPIGKDEKIVRVLSFDGNGNVTVYIMNDLTFADLKDKNRNQILELAEKQDREYFQNEFDSIKKDNLKILEPFLESNPSTESLNLVNFIKDMEFRYKAPSSTAYTLKAKTDRTGNNIEEEHIYFEHLSYQNDDYYYLDLFTRMIRAQSDVLVEFSEEDIEKMKVLSEKLEKSEYDILQIFPDRVSSSYNYELTPDYSVNQVYDMYFRGFHGFVTLVEDSMHPGFMLDTVATEGIILDEK